MSDGAARRSDEEREAARRAREAARSRRDAPAASGARWESIADDGEPPGRNHGSSGRENGAAGAGQPSAGWPEDEVPAGTRRVSRGGSSRPGGRSPRPAARSARPAARSGAGAGASAGVTRRPGGRAPREPGRHSRLVRAGSLLALAIVIAFLAFMNALFQPFHGDGHGSVTVRIPPSSSTSEIGSILVRDGVISSGFLFKLRVELAGDRGDLRSGTFRMKLGMSYGQAITVLTTPPPAVPTTNITMIPGERRVDFTAKLRAAGVKGNYLLHTRHSHVLNPVSYGAPAGTPSLEGFLFPDTYQLRVPVSISALIDDQLAQFKREFATVSMSYARAHRLTPYDVLIIASLVQAEAFTPHDMALVASVIYNRLHDGMLLGFDSTTRYAVGNFTKPLTQSELRSSSPWNTRKHAGLPPTPIDNPDLQAIRAAAHPPPTSYLYFVSKPCSNALAFSSNNAAFQRDVAAFSATQSQNGRPPLKRCK